MLSSPVTTRLPRSFAVRREPIIIGRRSTNLHSVFRRSGNPFAAEKLTFTLNWVAGGDHAPYFYAQKMGWYKQAGIDVDFETGRGSAASAQKVGAGQSQLGLSDMAGVLLFRGKGLDLVGLMNGYANSPQGLYWLKSNGINSIKDLAGKKIGNPAGDGA